MFDEFGNPSWRRIGCTGIFIIAILIAVGLVAVGHQYFGYFNFVVNTSEVGVRTVFGAVDRASIENGTWLLPPGAHTDFTLGADITTINIAYQPYAVTIPEVGLSGGTGTLNQTIGLVLGFDYALPSIVERPDLSQRCVNPRTGEDPICNSVLPLTYDVFQANRSFYLNETTQDQTLFRLTSQATRVCTGNLTLVQVAVGQPRNDLAACLETELQTQARLYGLEIRNVTITDVILPQSVLDSITNLTNAEQVRLQRQADARGTESGVNAQMTIDAALADQQRGISANNIYSTQAAVEADFSARGTLVAGQVTAQANIIYSTQAAVQLNADAQATNASIQQTAIAHNLVVQQAQATSDAYALEISLLQAQVQYDIVRFDTMSQRETERYLVEMYQNNPGYMAYLIALADAEAMSKISRIFYVDPSVDYSVLNGQLMDADGNPVNIQPILDVNAAATPAADQGN